MHRPMRRLRFISVSVWLAFFPACGSGKDSSHGAPVSPAAPQRSEGDQKAPGPLSTPPGQQPAASNPNGADTSVSNSRRSRVLGLFGGYVSCSGDANAPFKDTWMQRYLTEVQQGLKKSGAPETVYIMSCFKLDVSRVVFITSDKPSELREDSIPQLFSAFEASFNKSPDTTVSIVGHSYGGWLSLSLLDQVKNKFPVDSLITLDPISRSQCTPPDVLNSFLGDPPAPGCTRAPTDFDATKLTAIKQRTKTWLNIYQTDSRLLHSGQLLGAENIKRNYPQGEHEAHGKITVDPEVVRKVTALLGR